MRIHTFLNTVFGCCLVVACTGIAVDDRQAVSRGGVIFSKECAQCHGRDGEGGGPESLGLGVVPPDLTMLSVRNDGTFPREFVRRFVLGLLDNDVPEPTMPEFSKIGLRHVYPNGGADGEVLEADFVDLIEYLESVQKRPQ